MSDKKKLADDVKKAIEELDRAVKAAIKSGLDVEINGWDRNSKSAYELRDIYANISETTKY
jgi:nucleoid DNA-binding protein